MQSYLGKCADRNWRWKPMKSLNQTHGYDTVVGVTKAIVQTRGGSFPKDLPVVEGLAIDYTPTEVVITSRLSTLKTENIERSESIRQYIEAYLKEADSAVFMVRKSTKQLRILVCGKL